MRIVLEEIIEFLLKNIKAVAIYPLHIQFSLQFPYSISSVKTTRMNFFVRYMVTTLHIKGSTNFCEAQGKGRAKGRPRKVTQRSFIDSGWWMMDILSLMLYIKFG